MDSKSQLFSKTIQAHIQSLLQDLNDANAREKLDIINCIINDIEKSKNVVEEVMNMATEKAAFTKTGEKKYYPDTTKEKLRL